MKNICFLCALVTVMSACVSPPALPDKKDFEVKEVVKYVERPDEFEETPECDAIKKETDRNLCILSTENTRLRKENRELKRQNFELFQNLKTRN